MKKNYLNIYRNLSNVFEERNLIIFEKNQKGMNNIIHYTTKKSERFQQNVEKKFLNTAIWFDWYSSTWLINKNQKFLLEELKKLYAINKYKKEIVKGNQTIQKARKMKMTNGWFVEKH